MKKPSVHDTYPEVSEGFANTLTSSCRYNPVLGEIFRCRYDYKNGTQGFYISEQGIATLVATPELRPDASVTVSHHPPISCYFYVSPENKIKITGEIRPKSKFLGNSVATTMEGENRIVLLGRPEDGGKQRAMICIRYRLIQIYQSM